MSEGDLMETANKLANYLHVMLAIEYDIDIVDRIAKARRLDDFIEAIYNALRRRFTLEKRIQEIWPKIKDDKKEDLNRAFTHIKNFNPSDVEIIRNRLTGQPFRIKEIASYVGSKSIASTVLFDNLRKIMEGG
ncbi:MAG: hypothetical protein RMI79_07370 [Nitrososphaerota archaeon]|nr:hypothetical protein [Nitrososphaerota archaeon]